MRRARYLSLMSAIGMASGAALAAPPEVELVRLEIDGPSTYVSWSYLVSDCDFPPCTPIEGWFEGTNFRFIEWQGDPVVEMQEGAYFSEDTGGDIVDFFAGPPLVRVQATLACGMTPWRQATPRTIEFDLSSEFSGTVEVIRQPPPGTNGTIEWAGLYSPGRLGGPYLMPFVRVNDSSTRLIRGWNMFSYDPFFAPNPPTESGLLAIGEYYFLGNLSDLGQRDLNLENVQLPTDGDPPRVEGHAFVTGRIAFQSMAGCLGDWDTSGGQPNSSDFLAYLNDFAAQDPAADLAPPFFEGGLDSSDFLAFLNLYAQGC